MPKLKIKSPPVAKSFGQQRILITGPIGVGKSTLARIIQAGFLRPTNTVTPAICAQVFEAWDIIKCRRSAAVEIAEYWKDGYSLIFVATTEEAKHPRFRQVALAIDRVITLHKNKHYGKVADSIDWTNVGSLKIGKPIRRETRRRIEAGIKKHQKNKSGCPHGIPLSEHCPHCIQGEWEAYQNR